LVDSLIYSIQILDYELLLQKLQFLVQGLKVRKLEFLEPFEEDPEVCQRSSVQVLHDLFHLEDLAARYLLKRYHA